MSMTGRYLPLTHEQYLAVAAEPSVAEELAFSQEDSAAGAELDIDKAWHLIHFLLTGEPWSGTGPLANAVLGGMELEGTDAGYGPFRLLEPNGVALTSVALAAVSPDALWARLDLPRLEEASIYPEGWTGSEEERTYTLSHYMALQRLFLEAARAGKAMLLYLC